MFKYQKYITRQDLKDNPNTYYVFGDNFERRGFGGQAKEMRGEYNAIGIPTKHLPTMDKYAFFHDKDYYSIISDISKDLSFIHGVLKTGDDVIWPEDGIGTGLSKLPETAPRIWKFLEEQRLYFEKTFGPNKQAQAQKPDQMDLADS